MTDTAFFLSRLQEIVFYLLPQSAARMRLRKNAAAVPN
jgi:hypothetical protein